ncbi:MAG: VOC family protein [Cyclobacteriaceae bacterium]
MIRYTKTVLVILAISLSAFKSDTLQQHDGLIPDKKMAHIGIVVKDIEASLDNWVKLLGLKERPKINIAAGHEDNPTHYRGKPSNAKAKLAFLPLDNMQVELIEPIGDAPSHWQEFLDTKGEGVHHVAFWLKGLGEQYIGNFEKNGLSLVQQGGWDGGEYGYFNGLESHGVMIELLENYNKE